MDDLPLSQRRELMRQMSFSNRPASGMALHHPAAMASSPAVIVPATIADVAAFDSHQPIRDSSHVKSEETRQAQLAASCNSASAELRSETPVAGGAHGKRLSPQPTRRRRAPEHAGFAQLANEPAGKPSRNVKRWSGRRRSGMRPCLNT